MCWLDPDFEPEHGDEPNDSDHELAEEPSAHKRRYEFAIAPGDNPVERWEPLPAARRRALLGIDCCREGPDAADPGDAEEDRFEDLIEAGFTHRYPVPGACGFRAGGPLDVMLPGTPASPASTPASPAGPAPGPGALPGVNLTMPAATWLGYADRPGDITGTGAAGPADAGTCRHLADLMAASPATRWCLTLTDKAGRPIAHGCARAGPGPPGPPGTDRHAWLTTMKITPIETTTCAHRYQSTSYQPSPALRHRIKIRSPRCGFPGCRRRRVTGYIQSAWRGQASRVSTISGGPSAGRWSVAA